MRFPSWVTAASTVGAAAASFFTVHALSWWLGAGPNAAILSAVLALSFACRRPESGPHPWAWELAGILAVGVAAGLVGWLLRTDYWVGAALFTAVLFLSVWLRRFGGRARQLSRVMAMPFIAVLVAPGLPHAAGGAWVNLLLLLAAAVIAFGWDVLLNLLTRTPAVASVVTPAWRAPDQKGLPASTRMAAQMAVALAAAFTGAHFLFPNHWGWVVLTAFIVCSGAIGRGDAVYKGVLRFGGALLGAVIAACLEYLFVPQGVTTALLIFATLFVGTWLRESSYAWWSACITLAVALLSGSNGVPIAELLGQRLLAILLGAGCGVAACWFVLPITTRAAVRRRIAEALLALELLAGAEDDTREQRRRDFARAAAECRHMSPRVAWHRRLTRVGPEAEHPGVWLAIVGTLAEFPPASARQDLVKAVRASRRALKEDRGLTPALRKVEGLLTETC